MNTPWNLTRLIAPVSVETFFREHWEQTPLVVRREDPTRHEPLLTLDLLESLLHDRHLHHPGLSLTDAARKLAPDEYTYGSGLIDAARFAQHFDEGATMVFSGLETSIAPLAALCRAMESELSVRFQTNVYRTPGNAQGFRTHYDSHDVFALQVHGRKLWTLYDTPVELPFRRQEFHPAEVPVGAARETFELAPGDVAYIPRGVLHDARNVDGEESVHITLGVLHTSWADLLAESLARLGLRDADFRRGLPPGFARDGFDREGARARFKQLLDRFAAEATFDDVLDHFADDLVGTRHPILPGQVAQLRALPTLSVDAVLRPRPSLLFRLREEGEQVVLSVYGSEIAFPRHAGEALRASLHADSMRVSELPGDLDDAGRLVLVRRLVREGLVTVE